MGGSSKKATVGYKHYVGMHMALCHGPVDKVVRIRVGGKDAWAGESTGGAIQIDQSGLFGGEKREGGVSGQVDIEMGGPTQGQNSYLASKLGADLLPAFRGVCCAVLRQVYVGLNPYMKDWGWLAQRIHKRKNGELQWYDAFSEIGSYSTNYVSQDERIVIYDGNKYEVTGKTTGATGASIEEYFGFVELGGTYTLSRNLSFATYENRFPTGVDDIVRCPDGIVRKVGASYGSIHGQSDSDCMGALSDWFWNGNGWFDHYFERQVLGCRAQRHTYTVINQEYATYTMRRISSGGSGQYADMNPAHIIRECLTDPNWGMGYPESDMGDSFEVAAEKLYVEGMGISILWSQQTSIEDFVEEILRHIDAALYVDRTTGKFELKLIRNDYNESSLLVLGKPNISRVEGYTKQTLAELVNEITVTYNSNETGQPETVTIQNLALIQQQGAIIPATVDYPGFSREAIAVRVAARDLKAMSTPLVTATVYSNRSAAHLNIGDVFKWNWVEEDEDGAGVATSYVMRVTEIALGDGVDNTVRIQCAQDVFALPDITYVEAEPTEWVNPSVAPVAATPRLVVETPYYEIVRQLGEVDAAAKLSGLPELGYLMVAAGRAGSEINAEIQIDSGAGYAEGGSLEFCPCAKLDGAIGFLDTTATLKNGVDLDVFVAGSLAQIGTEIVVIESIIDDVATIRRGCLDTVPSQHADGSAVIIWDGYGASDSVEYVDSDELDVKILTVNGIGLLALAAAPIDSLTMDQRAFRPYPPANVQIGGLYYPSVIVADDLVGIVSTWVHRDRLQQTGGTVLGWTAASVGPEAGVTYSARLVRTDTEAELDAESAISGTTVTFTPTYRGNVRLELWAERDGLECFQVFAHTFFYVAVAPVYYDSAVVYYDGKEVHYEL